MTTSSPSEYRDEDSQSDWGSEHSIDSRALSDVEDDYLAVSYGCSGDEDTSELSQ